MKDTRLRAQVERAAPCSVGIQLLLRSVQGSDARRREMEQRIYGVGCRS